MYKTVLLNFCYLKKKCTLAVWFWSPYNLLAGADRFRGEPTSIINVVYNEASTCILM